MDRYRLIALVVAYGICGGSASAQSTLFKELTDEGVMFSTGDRVTIAQPSMADGLTRAEQEKVIQKVAPRYPLSLFLRDSWTAPQMLSIESVKGSSGDRIGHRVDVWFVAHGSLETLTDEQVLKDIQEQPKKQDEDVPSTGRELTEEELEARGLRTVSTETEREGWAYFETPLFDRVLVSGVTHSVMDKSDRSILGASKIDPRLNDDPKLPNQWQKISRDARRQLELGPPQPYSGYGMTAKVTPLVDDAGEPTGALFIETHVVFEEPRAWFDGAPLIRSKLPLLIQDRVRDFRREFKEAEERRREKAGDGD